jgi:hypothetical protein
MKIFYLLLFIFPAVVFSQVGIGTNTPNSSSVLDVTATNKGFLPPRIALTGTNDVATISSPATGLMVYNTATAGTSPSNVIPGFYYFESGKWQRVINQQPDATVNFNTSNPTTGSPTFTPNTPASSNYIYVSSIDNSQWTWNGTTYVTYTPPVSTPWNLAGSSNDAGSNKTAAITRSGKLGIGNNNPNATIDARTNPTSISDPGAGFIGVGTTTTSADGAGAGAVRYNNGMMEYSNGSKWESLAKGKSPIYAQYKANAYQGSFTIDVTKVNFPTQVINLDDKIISSNSNTFILPANRTYRIDLNLGYKNGGWCRFAIYDSNTGFSETAHMESGVLSGTGTITRFITTSSSSSSIDVRMRAGGCILNDQNNGGTYATLTIQAID